MKNAIVFAAIIFSQVSFAGAKACKTAVRVGETSEGTSARGQKFVCGTAPDQIQVTGRFLSKIKLVDVEFSVADYAAKKYVPVLTIPELLVTRVSFLRRRVPRSRPVVRAEAGGEWEPEVELNANVSYEYDPKEDSIGYGDKMILTDVKATIRYPDGRTIEASLNCKLVK
jgi:hypothetical protein